MNYNTTSANKTIRIIISITHGIICVHFDSPFPNHLAPQVRFELTTFALGKRCSIPLSYCGVYGGVIGIRILCPERHVLISSQTQLPAGYPLHLAEAVGFEPTEDFSSSVFKTGALSHSATLPYYYLVNRAASFLLPRERGNRNRRIKRRARKTAVGAPSRIWTSNQPLTKRMLCLLSYGSISCCKFTIHT